MKTIFNTYIELENQEQANRLKQVCIDNGLKFGKSSLAFEIFKVDKNPIFCNNEGKFFVVDLFYFDDKDHQSSHTKVTEKEWIELLKKEKI